MAKIKAPLLSLKAWGTVAKSLTFRRRKSLIDALKTPLPTDAKTAIQRTQRLLFQDAVAWWHNLTMEEKLAYDAPGREHHMSGYAWFIRSYLLNPPAATFLSLTDTPDIYTGEAGHQPIVNAAEDALAWGTIKEYPSGIVSIPGQSTGRAWLGHNQVIPSFFPTKVELDRTSFDVQSEFDTVNHRMIAEEHGYYVVSGLLGYQGILEDVLVYLFIYKNGVGMSTRAVVQGATGPAFLAPFVSDVAELDAGDFLELYTLHFMGAAQTIFGQEAGVFLSWAKVA